MERMQSEAVRRVKDMQQRARRSVNGNYNYGNNQNQSYNETQNRNRQNINQPNNGDHPPVQRWKFNERQTPEAARQNDRAQGGNNGRQSRGAPMNSCQRRSQNENRAEPPKRDFSAGKQTGGFDLLKMLNLKNLTLDSDRTLILLMLVLLSGEGADKILMLALAYILI